MGTGVVIGEDDEPSFEVDDDLDWVIRQINGWAFVCREGEVTYTGYAVPSSGAATLAESAEALAEQYGDDGRVWEYDRQTVESDGTIGTRRWTVTGPRLREALLYLAATAREASRRQQPMVLNMDD